MNSIIEVNNLLVEIKEVIEEGININISEEKHNRYKQYFEYLKSMKKKLDSEKLKFVFIGEKGKGKTTTILNLFGLIEGEEELLATGSGGTTVCEVELLESKHQYSYFEIIPVEDKYMEQYVYDFCSTYKQVDNNNNSIYVPSEIARSIRNMIKMKISEVKELYQKLDNFDEFVMEIKRKLFLEERTETIIKCESDKKGNFFSDIQKKFNAINLAKVANIKIPQKILLYLTEDVINFSDTNDILSIVDTRGIDSEISKDTSSGNSDSFKREDILNYIDKQQNECVFLFVDGIKAAPTPDILDTIKSRITKENADKFYLLINIYNDEAEKVMTDDGTAKTIEKGIEYKKEDILTKFRQEKIIFNENNLIFYNSKTNYPDSKSILNEISKNINTTREKTYGDCIDIKNAFEKLNYDFEDSSYAIKHFEELYANVLEIVAPRNLFDEIVKDFISDEMSKVHSSRLNAINRYQGDYYYYNFYHNFSITIEKTFDRIYSESKNDVLKKVTEFLGFKNITQLDEIDYKIFLEKLERDYLNQRETIKTIYKDKLLYLFQPQSWEMARSEYGSGSGYYTQRVCEIYKTELKRLDSTYSFKENFDNTWFEILEKNNLIKL